MAHRRARAIAPYAVALVGGAIAAASLPPLGIWPAGPIGVALFYLALRGRRARARGGAGLLFGIGWLCPGLAFIAAFSGVGYLALVVLGAAWWALASLLVPAGRARSISFIGAMTLAEWARDTAPFGGNPVASLASGQVSGPGIVLARLGGPLLLEMAVCAIAVGIAELALLVPAADRHRPATDANGALGAMALAVVIVVVALSGAAPSGAHSVGSRTVALIQGGGPRGLRSTAEPAIDAFTRTLDATVGVGHVDLVVWPEDTVPLGRSGLASGVATVVEDEAQALRASFVVGATEPVGTTRFLNEMLVVSPEGRVVARFEKVHPVPFGEYVPFRSLLSHVVNLSAVPLDMVRGHGSGEVTTPIGPIALVVSFESFFSSRARAGVRGGGELVVVPTNTASYASDQLPALELAASRLDAVAVGRDLVQAATVGYSAVVSSSGAVVATLRLDEPGALRATVSLRRGLTLYDRLGDVPVLVLAAGLVALGIVLARPRSSRRR